MGFESNYSLWTISIKVYNLIYGGFPPLYPFLALVPYIMGIYSRILRENIPIK